MKTITRHSFYQDANGLQAIVLTANGSIVVYVECKSCKKRWAHKETFETRFTPIKTKTDENNIT